MTPRRHLSHTLLAAILLTSCAADPPPRQAADPQSTTSTPPRVVRLDPAGQPITLGRISPPATLAGAPISWDTLHRSMVEAAGAIALEEAVLDRLLEAEAQRRGLVVESLDLRREEIALERSLASTSPAADPAALLLELRRRRALGPDRFEALLRRTALLRALVAPEVNLTPESLDLALAIRYGERRRVRLLTVTSLIEAQTALRRLEQGEPFAEVAARFSNDASAPRGDLIDPFSPDDPSYPAALRQAATRLAPGERSAPIALTGTYALLELVEIIPARDVELATVRPLVVEDARAEQERILMERAARRLLENAPLNILDPALETAWRRRGNQ